jgi:hypothetical protein
MAWFDAYESVSNRNKWRRLSANADRRKEATKLLDEEKQKRDRIKKRYTDYSDAIDVSGSILNRKDRDRDSATTRIREAEKKIVPLSRVFYPEGESIAAKTQREFAEATGATAEPHYKLAEAEWPAEQEAKELAAKEKEKQELRDELALREIGRQTGIGVRNLNLTNTAEFAVNYALNPYNYIPLDSFADPEVRDFVTDIRSGNTDRIEELRDNKDMVNSFLEESVKHFVSKFERPYTLNTLAQDNDLFKKESAGFAPTISEYLSFSTEDLVNQFSPQWEVDNGKLIPGGDRAVFPWETRKLFSGSELDREIAVYSLPPDKQADFIGSWFQTQLSLIEDGNFDQIQAVPVFSKLLKGELETKLNTLLHQRRVPTDDEREEIMFLSLITGYEEIPLTPEQRKKILEHFGPLKEEQLTALQEEYGEEYSLGDLLKTFIGRGDFINALVGRGPGQAPTFEDTEASKELADIMEFQLFARNITKEEDWEGLDPKYHPVSLMIESFDGGVKLSRPLVRKILIPILSPVVGKIAQQTGLPQLAEGVNLGLGAIGVPDLAPDTEKVSRDVIESKIFETGLAELLNPANVVFVIPFVGPGSRFVRAYQAGNKTLAAAILADEFALLGNTPAAIDSIMRGVAYTSRYGLKATLTKWPKLRDNQVFMNLMSGLDKKVVRREVEHEVGRVTAANADILEKNKVLELLLSRGDAPIEEALKGMDGNALKVISEAYNAGVVEYPLREDLAARLLDLDVVKQVDDGPAMVKSVLEGRSTIGPGFPSGRQILDDVGDAIVPVTDDLIRLRKTRFETFGEVEQLVKERGRLQRELGERTKEYTFADEALSEAELDKLLKAMNDAEEKVAAITRELDVRGEEVDVGTGTVNRLGDEAATDEWYLEKGIIDDSELTVEDIRFADTVLEDPTRKPIGSGFVHDSVDENYETRVAEIVRRADFIKEDTGREFYFRESFDETEDGYIFSVFGVNDEAASFIRDNVDGLPTDVGAFLKYIDTNKNLSGDQKQFVDKLFDMGKSADELDMDAVERGISSKIRGHVDDMDAFNTSDLATKEGRQALADAQKNIIETIAYGIVRNDPQLGTKLNNRLKQFYDGFQTLPEGSNGLMNAFGEFIDLGDELPATVIKRVWDDQVPNARRFVTQAKATESDSTLAAITRFMDETATIAITRQGDDKIVVEAVRFIDEPQATALRTLIDNEGISDISFSFDKVYGIRAGERQTLYKGKTGKAFDDVLKDSTGVCSL